MSDSNQELQSSYAIVSSSPQSNQYKVPNKKSPSPPNDKRKIPDLESGIYLEGNTLRRRQENFYVDPNVLDSVSSSLSDRKRNEQRSDVNPVAARTADPIKPDGLPPKQQSKPAKKARFINPSGSVCYWWSAVVSLAFLYNFWSASYRFAFREIDTSTVLIWLSIDLAAELIYWLDIFANRKTGYLEDGVLQRDPKKIRVHYQESNLFYLDVFCVLPFDVLYLSFGYNSIFRCNRLVKIYKFWSFVDRTERHTNYPNVFRTCTLVHNILVIFHWNACIFHMISTHKIIDDIEGLYKIDHNYCKDVSCQYLHAFYWSTLAIIGNLPRPKTKGEYVYVIFELIFGLILFAWVLGHVANIVTNVSAARKEFQARLDAVKTFMRARRVSDELQTKVIRWFDYLWSSQKSSDEERSVACLPDRLKAEIAIHVNLATLERVDIFRATEVGFLRELVLRLKPVLFSPGDYVCRKDEAGHEMYIVSRGILEVVTGEDQKVVAIFTAGSYFGEIAVLNVGSAGNKRTASVRSVGYSDLFCLSKQDLWDVLKDYPKAEARIRAVAEDRLTALEKGKQVRGDNQVAPSSNRRSRSERGTDQNSGLSQSQTRNQDGCRSSTSMLNNNNNNNGNNNQDGGRRMSQRSSRSRVQPSGTANEHWHDMEQNEYNKQLECFSRLLPVEQPARLRPYGSAISHRPTVAGGTQFRGRKCLNSHTMEPIYNSVELGQPVQQQQQQQQVGPMLMLGHLPIGLSEPATRVHHYHLCHHASALHDLSHHCRARQDDGQLMAHQPGGVGGLVNFPPASPRQHNLQDGAMQHLSVQPHLGQSRSFECSPIGVGGRNQPLCAANRSRSGASLSARTTPAQTSDDNQTLTTEQDGACNRTNWQDVSSAKSIDTDQTSEMPRTSMSRPLLCHHQAQQQHQHHGHHQQPSSSSQLLACSSHLRERSSSMTNKLGLAIDDDFGFDDGEEDESDRDEPGHAYQWHQPASVQPTLAQNQAGAPGGSAIVARRQRHRQDCRHHGLPQQPDQTSITVAPTADNSILLSSSSTATLTSDRQTLPPYGPTARGSPGTIQQPAGTGCQTTKEQSLGDASSGQTATTTTTAAANRCDESPATPSSSSTSTSAPTQPAKIGAKEQLVVDKGDKTSSPNEDRQMLTSASDSSAGPPTSVPNRWSSQAVAAASETDATDCCIEMVPEDIQPVKNR